MAGGQSRNGAMQDQIDDTITDAVWAAPGFVDTEIRCFMELEGTMQRRRFSREFKLEAVKLVRERGVTAVQAARARMPAGESQLTCTQCRYDIPRS